MSEGAASFWVQKEGWKTVRPSKEERGQRKEEGEGRGRGVQITERDVAAIAWIADQYAVRSDVLRWLLGDGQPLSESRTRALVARWQRAGLVHAKRFSPDLPRSSGPPGRGRGWCARGGGGESQPWPCSPTTTPCPWSGWASNAEARAPTGCASGPSTSSAVCPMPMFPTASSKAATGWRRQWRWS